MPGGIVRHWRHLPLRRPAPGGLAAARGPARCDIVPVRTGTMWHRAGCGAVAGAAAARREGPPGSAGREGCARSYRRAALRSPAGNSLLKSHTYAASTSYGPRAARPGGGRPDPAGATPAAGPCDTTGHRPGGLPGHSTQERPQPPPLKIIRPGISRPENHRHPGSAGRIKIIKLGWPAAVTARTCIPGLPGPICVTFAPGRGGCVPSGKGGQS
jgi:hypothetical protein